MGVSKHLSTDNDPLYRFHRWQANLRILEIDELKSVLYVAISHPFVERLIGTIRREYLDHVLYWNAVDLESKLDDFKVYYNKSRVHASLKGKTPAEAAGCRVKPSIDIANYRWGKNCRGLFQLPVAV